jgi:hypothetical protein
VEPKRHQWSAPCNQPTTNPLLAEPMRSMGWCGPWVGEGPKFFFKETFRPDLPWRGNEFMGFLQDEHAAVAIRTSVKYSVVENRSACLRVYLRTRGYGTPVNTLVHTPLPK